MVGFTNGPAPAFGSCALVLSHHATARTTFVFGDSSERHEEIGTEDAFEPVLAALFERVAQTGQMLGLAEVSVHELVKRLSSNTARTPVFSRVLDDYIETHTHGPIRLAADADALLLDPSYRETATGAALLDAATRYRLGVHWHPGSKLSSNTFPTTTPVHNGAKPNRWQRFLLSGRAAQLAARVISEHADETRLTAASIGSAACSYQRQPAKWQEWEAPDASLTVLKDLWRVLAAHGRPLNEQ